MEQNPITDATLIERDPDLVHAEVDGEAIMMSISHASYFGLNGVGTRIWNLLETATDIDTLCRRLTEEYEVADGDCRREVRAFVEKLIASGIVRACTRP